MFVWRIPKSYSFPLVRALELLNVKPSKSVDMVGDTPDGIRAALACGCRCVGIATPENAKVSEAVGKAHGTRKSSTTVIECGADFVGART